MAGVVARAGWAASFRRAASRWRRQHTDRGTQTHAVDRPGPLAGDDAHMIEGAVQAAGTSLSLGPDGVASTLERAEQTLATSTSFQSGAAGDLHSRGDDGGSGSPRPLASRDGEGLCYPGGSELYRPASGRLPTGQARSACPQIVPQPRWAREFWRHQLAAGARTGSLRTRRSKSADCQGDRTCMDRAFLGDVEWNCLSPGGLVAILLGPRAGEPTGCRRCGGDLGFLTTVHCGRCGAALCGGGCVVSCGWTGLGFVSGCTARFCRDCEPIHTCSRRLSCGASCRYPHAGLGKRVNPRRGKEHLAGRAESRSTSSPPGGAGFPPRPMNYDGDDWCIN